MKDFHSQFSALLESGVPFVAVSVVDASGSTPGAVGSKMLVTQAGIQAGTVGGGRLEQRTLQEAQTLLASRDTSEGSQHRFFDWSLSKDIGMTCGGRVRLFFERHGAAAWDIRIFGAGHVAQALVRLLVTLPCRVHCYDTRTEWLARLDEDPGLVKVHTSDLAAEVSGIPPAAFVLLMTMGHATDLPILAELLRTRRQEYLGVIGSKSKRAILRKELIELGVEATLAEQFYCPIGLPLGSDAPAEIAVSVAAQLLQQRDRVPTSVLT